jgi:hypothetical protein
MSQPGSIQAGLTVMADLMARLNTLFSKVKDLDAQLGNLTLVCGGQTFCSMEDCAAFIMAYVPGNTYGYFHDMASLLQRCWGKNHVSVSKVWDLLYHMKKAGFTCKAEAIIYVSMSTILLTCLGKLTGKPSKSTHLMPRLPTHGHCSKERAWASSTMVRTVPKRDQRQGYNLATSKGKDLELYVDADFSGIWDPNET